MQEHGVSRLVVISSEVAEHWAHQGLFKLWVVLPLLQHFLGATYDDMRRMAEFVSRGWIRLEARAVVILDLPRLRQRSR